MVLAIKEITKEANTAIPPKVTPMIAEFADVFPEDLPDKLPPMRDIQHTIDLVPGASLLNLLHYRMNPTELIELKRQVNGLMRKGFIQESTSPCAFSVLLMPKKTDFSVCVQIVMPSIR